MLTSHRTTLAGRLARYRYDTDAIKRCNPIADVIGRDVALKRSGTSLVGLCPFHAEDTPSFYVSPEKGLFHCFGCNVAGDVLRYLQVRHSLSFEDACAMLGGARRGDLAALWALQDARDAGQPAHEPEPEVVPTPAECNLLALALERYEANLWRSRAALEYLLGTRGLAQRTVREARLGLGGGGDLLVRNTPDAVRLAEGLGMIDRFGRDRFSGRIIIPCLSAGAAPLWWTGRAMPGSPHVVKPQAKYLDLARLSKPLLGYAEAWQADGPQSGSVLIVEGPFDWLVARAWGYTAVALTGTHPGEPALHRLRALMEARPCLLVLDADAAGGRAVESLLALLDLPQAHLPGVIRLHGGKDLGELATHPHGPALLAEQVARANAARTPAVSEHAQQTARSAP